MQITKAVAHVPLQAGNSVRHKSADAGSALRWSLGVLRGRCSHYNSRQPLRAIGTTYRRTGRNQNTHWMLLPWTPHKTGSRSVQRPKAMLGLEPRFPPTSASRRCSRCHRLRARSSRSHRLCRSQHRYLIQTMRAFFFFLYFLNLCEFPLMLK